jgi:hypothetical protein
MIGDLLCFLGFHRWSYKTIIWMHGGSIDATSCDRCYLPLDNTKR